MVRSGGNLAGWRSKKPYGGKEFLLRLEGQPRWWALREVVGSSEPEEREAVSPPGWSGTVEQMKDHGEIDNPWALAWWMKGKGYKPHHKEKKRKKGEGDMFRVDAKMIGEIVDEIVTAKRPKKETRGTCVFQSDSSMVTDGKDHFPINSLAQARNALARVMQYDAAPSWYKGSLKGLQSAVRRGVYKAYPGLKQRKKERED